jgi:hypothetical protein
MATPRRFSTLALRQKSLKMTRLLTMVTPAAKDHNHVN